MTGGQEDGRTGKCSPGLPSSRHPVLLSSCLLLAAACTLRTLERRIVSPDQAQTLDRRSPFLKAHLRSGHVYVFSTWTWSDSTGRVIGDATLYDAAQQLNLTAKSGASKIAALSSGEFAGITADSPDQPMPLKAFHCQVKLEPQPARTDNPLPSKKVSTEAVNQVFQQIQEEAKRIVENRLNDMRSNPTLARLILNPKVGARRRKQTKL